jgi:uncharacterized membrane protein
MKKLISSIKEIMKYFFSGLMYILPVVLFFYIMILTFDLTKSLYISLVGKIHSQSTTVMLISATAFAIAYVGYYINEKKKIDIIHFIENKIFELPFVGSIAKMIKDLISSLSGDNDSYLGSVIVPFTGGKAFGLLTKRVIINDEGHVIEVDDAYVERDEYDTVNYIVFVPTAPNPTNGFLTMYKKKDIQFITMSTKDVFDFNLSLGKSGLSNG